MSESGRMSRGSTRLTSSTGLLIKYRESESTRLSTALNGTDSCS